MRLPDRLPVRLVLAFAAGGLCVLAFAPFSQGWVALLSLALLFLLWRDASPGQAFWTGWSWGAGLMGFGVFWLHNSIAQFGGLNLPLAIFITLLFAVFVALFPGLAGWGANHLTAARLPRLLLAYPACWVLLEWSRSWVLTGFPWLSMGYSQIDSILAGYAPVLGVYGISLVALLMAGSLLLWRSPWIVLLPILGLGGWSLQNIAWTSAAGAPFTASLVQASIPQHQKWLPSQLGPTLDFYVAETEKLTHSRLTVWPETAVPAFADKVETEFLQPLHEHLKNQGRDLLLGIPVREEDGRYYNSLLALGASGRGRYDKRHLVPFGEFMPFARVLQPLIRMLAIPMSSFSAGDDDKPPLLKLAGYPAGVSICYEDAFPGQVSQALPEAAFLLNASNDAWFGDSLAPYQHLEMARMRALETGRFMLRATNTGISAIIDERGWVMRYLPWGKRGTITERIQPLAGSTPYVRAGNGLVLGLLLLMLLAAYLRRAGGAPSTP
ncbi:apolipoprotein N-acyltransferase [Thiolapillus brandeum]|uniref:Apolipoprotein N-acyltransferase n=1 Tax=Thiolapillus brandeum TaxID=1076588 RepID=A0A7U6GLB4_9GAMM|nr:apolipoprotein N-acyltransferase [Thiolapillus brandeum]BAO45751.1 apolipoprotein N-acyltransferase [Thiolapillus brandeum]